MKTNVVETMLRGIASQQLGLLVAFASALTLGIGLILWATKPGYSPVYDHLTGEDAARITEILNADNIPYRIQPKSGQILVPADQVETLRIKLSASGLPASTSVGLELLQQEQALGTSQFIETARYQHALETELSRTISKMRNIESARVHLALPRQSVFIRDREKASASVMLKLNPGRILGEGQVLAMINLVASSIPYLQSSEVTIVDQWGQLLSAGNESVANAKVSKQFKYARKIEALYVKRIEEILTPLIGKGRVHASVTAEIDFSENEETRESFEADPAKIRSEQNQEQQSTGAGAKGIPGALTNQPPGEGTTDPQQTNVAEGSKPGNSNKQLTRNYELDKTISHLRKASGGILRISAAVIVDDNITVDDKGEIVRTPLEPEVIAQFTSLAREAVGFNEQRGDSVVVLNRSFQPAEEIAAIEAPPIWEQPWLWNLTKQVFAGLSILLLILMILRPAMKNLLPVKDADTKKLQHEGIQASLTDMQLSDDQVTVGQGDVAQLPPPSKVYGDILHMARAMAAEDPKRVAKVVKDWVGDSE